MKRILVFLFCLHSIVTQAQQPLSASTTHSALHYVYRLVHSETLKIYRQAKKDDVWPDEAYLQSLITTYPHGQDFPSNLPPDNYLDVYANGNNLIYSFHPVRNVGLKVITNNYDLALLVHDLNGKPLSGAIVTINKRVVPWNEATQSYRLHRYKKSGTIVVHYHGVMNIFDIPTEKAWHRKAWWKKIFSRPHQYKPNYDFYNHTPSEARYKGFMTFNKAKYKPNDTLRLKAFITTAGNKPVNEPLLLRLSDSRGNLDTILGTVRPYRPGGYDTTVVLNEELDLELDDQYLFTLETLSGKKYMLKDNDGDLDDREFAAKRPVLMRGYFVHEEYELKSTHFTSRTDAKEHTRGMPLSLYLKATDENDLPVMDGRVSITVTPNNTSQYHANTVFMPDTLWQYETALETTGETKVVLPDSIFPAASFSYNIESHFLNSNNESRQHSNSVQYKYNQAQISFTPHNDSLTITYSLAGKPVPQQARLILKNSASDTVSTAAIQLPAILPVLPFVKSYEIITDSVRQSFEINQRKSSLQCNASRTPDSVFVTINNPENLYYWYSIFDGNKLITQGYSRQFSWKAATRSSQCYFVSVQYVWNDEVVNDQFMIPYLDKQLQVIINNPVAVYPGQTSRIGVTVVDGDGRPVKDADVTAYAMTAKFETAKLPDLPYTGQRFRMRKAYNRHRLEYPNIQSDELPMTWERWKKEMVLDSITYYQFLHPDGIYYNREPTATGFTELAPFVVANGIIQHIAYIKIDEQPVYFDNTDLTPNYCFEVNPGRHKMELRTAQNSIIIDSIDVKKGMKNYISIASNATDPHIRIAKMRPQLTPEELLLRRRYVIPFQVDSRNELTYINQNEKIFQFTHDSRYGEPILLAGPLLNTNADYIIKGGFAQSFLPEAGYTFNIQHGLIKQRETKGLYIGSNGTSSRLYDHILTEKTIDRLWQAWLNEQSIPQDFLTTETGNHRTGKLLIAPDTAQQAKKIRQLFLYRYDDPAFVNIYTKTTTRINQLEPGYYRLLVLLHGDRYYIKDSIFIKENGTTFYRLQATKMVTSDATSLALAKAILDWKDHRNTPLEPAAASDFTLPFNNQYMDTTTFHHPVSGRVVDKDGHALPGVTVKLKGSNYGTVTNAQGRFRIFTSPAGSLVFQYIGFDEQTIRVNYRDYMEVKLRERNQALQEVVVTGYSTTHKASLTYSVSNVYSNSLQGTVAGVVIRGEATNSAAPPLILIDGIPFDGDLKGVDPKSIKDMTILKADVASAIYGSRAASGVVIITSTKSATTDMPTGSNSLRSHFRDDAFWQPRLRTNEKGEASFNVTFPDDITSWKTFAIAYTDKGQNGTATAQIKSYLPLSATLSLPAFAVAGDSINIIGKIMNYKKDSTTVNRSFSAYHQSVQNNAVYVLNSHIDTFPIRVQARDSVPLLYSISGANNYFDGEYRAIPVFEQGVKETKGLFLSLGTDTSFSLPAFADTGTLHLYAGTGVLPVLFDEIAYLQRYEYNCNEQMASKLIGLLLEKQARKFLDQPFTHQKEIWDLLHDLGKNKNQEGGWGWWNKSPTVYWVTQHVTTALLMAEKEGFQINMNKNALINYYVFELNSVNNSDKISLLEMLQSLEAKVDYASYLDTLKVPRNNEYDQFRLLYLKQRTGRKVNMDSLIAKQQTTILGNHYWGTDGYHLFNNSVQLTLLAYKILRAQGGQTTQLRNIRNWFMENRHSGNWRNTYESAAILATIMPDVLQAGEQTTPNLSINGQRIDSFPYSSSIPAGKPVQINKQGGANVYFTAWQQHWNPKPEKVTNQFAVSSRFLQLDSSVSYLTAGRTVVMEVKVDVQADADYVMLEIPIPAGCSYDNKNSAWTNQEIHREYFKNKVSIFSNYLTKGIHTFTISLMPRYTGYYHLNPAKAEMMYFPVFYGRESMKKVMINGK